MSRSIFSHETLILLHPLSWATSYITSLRFSRDTFTCPVDLNRPTQLAHSHSIMFKPYINSILQYIELEFRFEYFTAKIKNWVYNNTGRIFPLDHAINITSQLTTRIMLRYLFFTSSQLPKIRYAQTTNTVYSFLHPIWSRDQLGLAYKHQLIFNFKNDEPTQTLQ